MSSPPLTTVSGLRPLAITADPDLLDELVRLAAQVGLALDVAPDPAAAKPRFGRAPLVIVGVDQADACRRARLRRGAGLLLVGHRPQREGLPWNVVQELGAQHIGVLPDAETWLLDHLVDVAKTPAPAGRVIAVIGGRGGAGASTLAAGLAVTAVRAGLRTLLVDADPLGGGIDLVLGWENVSGLRWPSLREASGQVSPLALVEALPGQGDLVALSWDRGEVFGTTTDAMAAALDAGRLGRDIVVVDLPRALDAPAALALGRADQALLVVPAELRATAAATRVAAAVAPHRSSLAVVVRGPSPARLGAAEIAKSLKLPLAGALRPERALAAALERGEAPAGTGRGPLAALCRQLLDLEPTSDRRAA